MKVFKHFIAALVVGLCLVVLFLFWAARPKPESAQEAVARTLLREIFHAQKLYYQEWGCYVSIDNLPDKHLENPQKVKRTIHEEPVVGYYYKSMVEAKSWSVAAWPDISYRTTAQRSFYIDQTGALRSTRYVKEADSRANASSPISYVLD